MPFMTAEAPVEEAAATLLGADPEDSPPQAFAEHPGNHPQPRRFRVPTLVTAGLLALGITAGIFAVPSLLVAGEERRARRSSVDEVFVKSDDLDLDDLGGDLDLGDLDLGGDSGSSGGSSVSDKPLKGKDCEDMSRGTQCYKDVHYARAHIKAHPDWYVNLHEKSSPFAFQNFLHQQKVHGKPRCPKPCSKWKKDKPVTIWGKCHTTKEGEDCYNHVLYTQKENLPKHPEWYPGLSKHASFLEIQDYLHKQRVCPKPCGLSKLKKASAKKQVDAEKLCKYKMGKAKMACLNRADKQNGRCHNARPGEGCYGDIQYAQKMVKSGKHLEWYLGLNETSSFAMVQAFLHNQNSADTSRLCPLPCDRQAVKDLNEWHGVHCSTTQPGEECWKACEWVIKTGIKKHPKWYPNMTKKWTLEMVQNRLSKDKHSDCKSPACPCHTAEKGEKCFSSVKWVMGVGIRKHPKWYKGLTNTSSWEEIQARLHKDKKTSCQLPCAKTPWLGVAKAAP